MTQPQTNDGDRRLAMLLERQTRLGEATLLINDGLELDAVLQRVLDSARSLTVAHYGVMTTLDESGEIEDFLASGLTQGEAQGLWEMPGGREIFEYVNTMTGPWRVADFAGYARDMGLPEFRPPTPMSSFLTVPILHRGDRVGNIYIARGDPGQEFTQEDEETLVLFAAQAAMVIANARRYRDEQRARTALETLVETSPVGVAVFDARTGGLASFNREASRLMQQLKDTDQPTEQFIETLTIRRADGQEVSLLEWPMSEALSAGETVRAEEITLSIPDGRSITVLLNATPIRDEGGGLESFVVTLQDLTPLDEQEHLRAEFLGMVSHELRAPLTSIKGLGDHRAGRLGGAGPGRAAAVHAHHRRRGGHHARPHQRPAGRGPHRDGHAAGEPGAGRGDHAGRPGPKHLPERRGTAQPGHRPGAGPAPGVGGHETHRPGHRQPAVQRGPQLAGGVGNPGVGDAGGLGSRDIRRGRGPGDTLGASAGPVPQDIPGRRQRPGRGHRAGAGHLPGHRGGARGSHTGRERRAGDGSDVHLHPADGGGGRRPAPGAFGEAEEGGGSGQPAHPGG